MTQPDIARPNLDEPAITVPELARLVDKARSTPVAPVTVDAASITAGWQRRRSGQRRTALGGIAAVAAAVALFVGFSGGEAPSDPAREAAPIVAVPTVVPAAAGDEETLAPQAPTPTVPALADDITVVARAGSTAAEIVGAREIRLVSGEYEVRVLETATAPVTIRTSQGTVELEHGVLIVVLSGSTAPQITLEEGAANWVEADGTRRSLGGEQSERRPRTASAAQLAERADALQLAGNDSGAIEVLTRLVERYPTSAGARSATLDLARLLKKTGARDRARCAYGLYLERWPHSQIRDEVERARKRLGDGLACSGLQPKN